MTQEQFDTLIQRLEDFARNHPTTYKLRVGFLAALGYAYLLFILAGLLALFGVTVAVILYSRHVNAAIIKLALLILIPVFIVLKSLWVSFPPPTGLELNRQDVPRLFELIDQLTSALQAPKFHCVLLDREFNAGVVQKPRLGVFGWQQNYLIIGLPLMQALSPEQFRAVLAHEFGHLSANHSRFLGWIYRIRKTWVQILERLHQSGHHGSSILFEKFLTWYAPFFNAYSFVLARMDEYEADSCAAKLAGRDNTAEALINVAISSRFLQTSFWPNVYKQVDHLIEPPTAAFSNMFSALHSDVTPEDSTTWFEQALEQKTNNEDTHPCLADRLSALGYQQLELPTKFKVSASEEFLGNALNNFITYFDRSWKEEISTPWRQRYAYAQESLNSLQALHDKAKNQPLTSEEAWNQAALTVEFKGDQAAIPLLREILSTHPGHVLANYTLGQILLQHDDAIGIEHIELAMSQDLELVIYGCELIYSFLQKQGQTDKMKTYYKRAEQHNALIVKAQEERSNLKPRDKFLPHNLSSEVIQQLKEQLSSYRQIKQAYLVQKEVQYFPEKLFYILGVLRDRSTFELSSYHKDQALFNQLINQFSSNTFLLILNDTTKHIQKKLSKIEGALIYSKLKTKR